MLSQLEANLRSVRDRVERAARGAGGRAGAVTLLPVTKSVAPDVAAALVGLGCHELAENRAPELEEKARALEARGCAVRWHFVGHVQRNKARRVVRLAQVIHSVDSLRLLEHLERVAGAEGRRPGIYLQLNAAREARKSGFDPAQLDEALAALAELRHLVPLGLMAMGPLAPGPERDARTVFEEVAARAQAIAADPALAARFPGGRPRLSMGMSGDLEQAIAAGSDVVRVGSALFEDLPEVQGTPARRETP